jgi:hypothetical protein
MAQDRTNTHWWACSGKVGFGSPETAHKTVQRMAKYKQRRRGKIKVFKCDLCSQWHLGG